MTASQLLDNALKVKNDMDAWWLVDNSLAEEALARQDPALYDKVVHGITHIRVKFIESVELRWKI